MALPLITPTYLKQPQLGGTISLVAGTSGDVTTSRYRFVYQNYIYVAIPAQGFQFSHFTYEGNVHYTQTNPYDDPYSGTWSQSTGTASYSQHYGGWIHQSNMSGYTDYGRDGSVWYRTDDYYGTANEITALTVTAVFTRINPTDLLVYDPNQNGQLVYAPNDALVYDG